MHSEKSTFTRQESINIQVKSNQLNHEENYEYFILYVLSANILI